MQLYCIQSSNTATLFLGYPCKNRSLQCTHEHMNSAPLTHSNKWLPSSLFTEISLTSLESWTWWQNNSNEITSSGNPAASQTDISTQLPMKIIQRDIFLPKNPKGPLWVTVYHQIQTKHNSRSVSFQSFSRSETLQINHHRKLIDHTHKASEVQVCLSPSEQSLFPFSHKIQTLLALWHFLEFVILFLTNCLFIASYVAGHLQTCVVENKSSTTT